MNALPLAICTGVLGGLGLAFWDMGDAWMAAFCGACFAVVAGTTVLAFYSEMKR